MKNITVSVSDDVYRAARIRAAERGTSISALVADYLDSLAERDAEFERLTGQQRRVQRSITSFSGRNRFDRDELHERALR